MKPDKSLGQHWLHDFVSLDAIVEAAEVKSTDTVLEVGPGLGTLTARLLVTGAKVITVEFDPVLAEQLVKNVQEHLDEDLDMKNLSIIQADILKFDLSELPPHYKFVANIPYYLTSKLLRILSESSNPPSISSILVQKEVAQRMSAPPGAMSLMSVNAQLYSECSLGIIVPAELFTPPPKVDSQVLIMKRRAQPLFKDLDTKLFFRIVKAGFSERRKKLRSSLSGGLHITKSEADEILQKAKISPDARAQELSLQQWEKLTKVFN